MMKFRDNTSKWTHSCQQFWLFIFDFSKLITTYLSFKLYLHFKCLDLHRLHGKLDVMWLQTTILLKVNWRACIELGLTYNKLKKTNLILFSKFYPTRQEHCSRENKTKQVFKCTAI